jgi:hypothetical protein
VEVGQTLLLEAAALGHGRRLRHDHPARHGHGAGVELMKQFRPEFMDKNGQS